MYKEFFNFYADIPYFHFLLINRVGIYHYFSQKYFSKKRKKNKNHRRTSGKRNPESRQPFSDPQDRGAISQISTTPLATLPLPRTRLHARSD